VKRRPLAVVCLGDLMLELTHPFTDFPVRGATAIIPVSEGQIGGSAFNLTWYFANLGIVPRIVAPVSPGAFPAVERAIGGRGRVNYGLVEFSGPPNTLIMFKDGEEYRSLFILPSLPDRIRHELGRQRVPGILIFSGSRHRPVQDAYLDGLSDSANIVSIFAPSYGIYATEKTFLQSSIENSNLVVVNEDEAQFALKTLGKGKLEDMASRPGQALIVTRAAQGADLYREGLAQNIPSFSNSSRDILGAGDAFLAGLVLLLRDNANLNDAALVGAIMATFVVESEELRSAVSLKALKGRMRELGYSHISLCMRQ
jgi:sugar/nucleoside kinase (ribokinase family)